MTKIPTRAAIEIMTKTVTRTEQRLMDNHARKIRKIGILT